jgi:hypothetical protein
MAKRIRPWSAFALTVVVFALVGLTYYLWNYDYDKAKDAGSRGVAGVIMSKLTVDDYGRRISVNLSLFNAGNSQLWLADTAKTFPLYEVKLMYRKDANSTFEFVPLNQKFLAEQRRAHTDNKAPFSDDNDAVVHLVPGAGLTRNIELTEIFEPLKPGKYKVIVTYRPEVFKESMGSAFEALGAYAQRVDCASEFELPMPKAQPVSAELPKVPVIMRDLAAPKK